MIKKIIKYVLLSVLVYLGTYVVAVAIMGFFRQRGIHFIYFFRPYAYLSLLDVRLIRVVALAAGTLSLSFSLLIPYAKRVCADMVLVILSYCIPYVGLILGVILRARQDKITAISKAYILSSVASIASSLIVAFYYFFGRSIALMLFS